MNRIVKRAVATFCAAAAAWHAFAAPPERVVSLNLCTDQWLVLLAPEKIAGLTFLSRDPALSYVAKDASRFPVVRASAEAVLALHPDLVIGARFGARTTLDLLTRAGIPVERFDLPEDFPGIRAILRDFAARLSVPPGRAAALIERMDATLPVPGPPSRAMVWEPRGWTAGPGGLLDGVLRAAGLVNVGAGGRVGVEALLRRPPDLLVLAEGGGGISRATEMTRQPAIRGIPVRIIPAPLTICPGPFTAGAAAFLVEGR